MRVFEFFSGIGGLRLGLDEALREICKAKEEDISMEVVAAYDISTTANKAYEHNFKETPKCVSIEHLSLKDVDGLADFWLLSPPCQPYTRGGKRLDAQDGRATGFLHLLQLLEQCVSPPSLLFLENVRGFDGSDTWLHMQQVLTSQRYTFQQFLLSPTQLGIPNTRVRYYCLATRQAPHQQQRQQEHEPEGLNMARQEEASQLNLMPPSVGPGGPGLPGAPAAPPIRCVAEFLEKDISPDELAELLVPPSRLSRFIDSQQPSDTTPEAEETAGERDTESAETGGNGFRLEVITPKAIACGTFTKGYGRNLHSGGPLLLIESAEGEPAAHAASATTAATAVLEPHRLERGRFRRLRPGDSVRFFSSRELLRLHGFPESFGFPAYLPFRKRAALIGNSVNVKVVALLLQHLLQLYFGTR